MAHQLDNFTSKFGVNVVHYVNRSTHARRRVEAMGFMFFPIKVLPFGFCAAMDIRGKFRCVCNRTESFSIIVATIDVQDIDKPLYILKLDPVAWLNVEGAFSREHLERDGYKEVEINLILARGRQFDMKNPPPPPGDDGWIRDH